MARARLLSLLLLAGPWLAGPVAGQSNFADGLARLFSDSVREADQRLLEIGVELAKLPELRQAQQSPRLGFHSQHLPDEGEVHHVQIDLGAIYSIDRIVLVPAVVILPGVSGDGYGFPLRFKVEIGSEEDLSDATLIEDRTAKDFRNPGRFPVVYEQAGLEARYVRVTCTKCLRSQDQYLWAMGEIMVLSGNNNIARGRRVVATSSLEIPPTWSSKALTDGQSILGIPRTSQPSPTNGHMGKNARRPEEEKWVTVDLGAEYTLDRVRLIPAGPADFAEAAGMGFPKRFSVLLSNDPKFAGKVERLQSGGAGTRPWGNPHTIRANGRKGRYIRMEAHELWSGGRFRNFALAELQAYSGDENVAFGKQVAASDVFEPGEESRWAPEFLVDGYSSRNKLAEWPEYLALVAKRPSLEREQEKLLRRRDEKAERVAGIAIVTGGSLTALALAALGTVLVRQGAIRKRDSMRLREQIARDLHDDLGSNLGSISLLSELGSRVEELPEETRKDFMEIHETAERSAEAMRDIVWLIDSGSATLGDLVAKMREAADRILGDRVTLEVEPEEIPDRELSLLFRRHVLFAFKEALNNVRKHAGGARAQVRVTVTRGKLYFEVADDGRGFDLDDRLGTGHGLKNLQQRAQRLNGTCEIDSRLDQGTAIRFTAPLTRTIHVGRDGARNAGLAG